jgi:hypothetical protein
MVAYSDSPIFAHRPQKGICYNLLTATMIIVGAGAREINDSRHKLRLVPVVQVHKRIGLR